MLLSFLPESMTISLFSLITLDLWYMRSLVQKTLLDNLYEVFFQN